MNKSNGKYAYPAIEFFDEADTRLVRCKNQGFSLNRNIHLNLIG